MRVAFRDILRSKFVGPILRRTLLAPARRVQRFRAANKQARTDPARFHCPICSYNGMFSNVSSSGIVRRYYAVCPKCGSGERHRLQHHVLKLLSSTIDLSDKAVLHFAPEDFFNRSFRDGCKSYVTADLFRRDVDLLADICQLPVPDCSFDIVYASHVLEHVPDDHRAINEIYRVLKPGGIAVLPVPIYSTDDKSSSKTLEYGEAREEGHVRAPGLDYFDRYKAVFDQVRVIDSTEFKKEASDQLFIRFDLKSDGASMNVVLPDYVPICGKAPLTPLFN